MTEQAANMANTANAANANASPVLRIAVVGHTNAGKTSLLRTLTRRRDFGEVSPRPGATRHTEAVDLVAQGRVLVEFWDTPGLEDAVGLEVELQAFPGTPTERLQQLLASPLAAGDFEQEAKVIRALLGELDAAMLVIDCREPGLPKYQAEMRLLAACAKPIFPVMNHVAAPGAQLPLWQQALRQAGLHAHAVFDAVAPFAGAEQTLYADLASLLPHKRAQLEAVREALAHEARLRQQAATRLAAQSLVQLAQLRELVSVDELKQPQRKQQVLDAFQQRVMRALQAPQARLLALYGFEAGDAQLAEQRLAGDWADDLFNPALLKQVGLRLGKGAAIGAAVGAVADVALAGLSLGTGMALGATVGGIASQGWKPAWALLRNRLNGQQTLRLEDAALCLLAQRWAELIATLDARGHANAQQQLVGQELGQGGAGQTGMSPDVAQAWARELLALLHEAAALAADEEAEAPPELIDALAASLMQALTATVKQAM
jgi:hypothetical protein